MTASHRRAGGVLLLVCLGVGALWILSLARVTTRQAVNYQLSVKDIPLYAKVVAFLHRHVEYDLLAKEITRGLRSEPERVRAIFEWTRAHIRPTPKEWPIVDDHVLNIIVRGHGMGDQMADVFTTLATYAGIPAFWRQGQVVLSFARVDDRWAVFDVANGLVFADAQGRLLEIGELTADPMLIDAVAGRLTAEGKPYAEDVAERLQAFDVPDVLRAQRQMPWPRLAFEAHRAVRVSRGADARPTP